MALGQRVDEPWIEAESEVADDFALWPLNLMLVVLGASVVALAFTYLDSTDRRLFHNPWTYVVATPLVLLGIYLVFSNLFSRVIEKSMQMAFLLSVLVHLLFVIGAMNVVIFSRLWPDVLESLAQERHQLKLQSLQARQYYPDTSSQPSSDRPDYLRFAETEHQPTELTATKSPVSSLFDATQRSLVSPVPQLERTAEPHLVERRTNAASTATSHERVARLSRSEMQYDLERSDALEVPKRDSGSWEPPELQSSEAGMTRSDVSKTASEPMLNARPDGMPRMPSPSANRLPSRSSREVSPSASQVARLPSQRGDRTVGPGRAQAIDIPEAASEANSSPGQALSDAAGVDRTASRSRSSSPILDPPPGPATQRPWMLAENRPLRNRSESSLLESSVGESMRVPSRESAGGRAGLAVPSSLPIRGLEQLAAQSQASDEIVTPRLRVDRRSSKGRETGSLPSLGTPRAAEWRESAKVSQGMAGKTPLDVSFNDTSGEASSEDISGLRDAGKIIQPSRSGIGKPQLAAPSGSDIARTASNMGPPDQSEPAVRGPATSTGRERNSQPSVAQPSLTPTLADLSASLDSSTSTGWRLEIRRADLQGEQVEEFEPASSSAPRPRMRMEVGLPGSSVVEAEQDAAGKAELRDRLDSDGRPTTGVGLVQDSDTAQPDRSRRTERESNLLAIQATIGPGGISPNLDRMGRLLPERRERALDSRVEDLEVQRFPRQQVGGPLASGRVSVPQPAFKQRLNRLESRAAMDPSMVKPQTELAIERGLAFLAKYQRQDGSWRLQDFDTQVLMTSDTAATALALLAFQGAGYTHKEFKYADVCQRALQFLRSHQAMNGDLYIPQNPASDQNAWLYSHAIAAIALCEAYGMTQDPELRETAQKSIDFIVASQDPLRGGWRYRPGAGSDTSVSGWFMMALKSAQLAGLSVPGETFEGLKMFLERSRATDGRDYLFRYNPYAADTPQQRHGLKPTAVMTSVGLLMRLYSGWRREREEMVQGADFLLRHLPEHGTTENSRRDTYYWYYATQVMFHMGGDTWKAWQDQLYPLLIDHQVTSGEYEGSWEPLTPTPDLWARFGGRLYVTTMNLLSLEVTYRHLPLYEATAPDSP